MSLSGAISFSANKPFRVCSFCNVKYPNMIPTDVLESCYRKEFYFVRDNKGVKFDYVRKT